MDPTLVVLISFVIFMGIAYRLGYKQSMAALDNKIETIRTMLNEATKAKEDALQALNEENRYHGEIMEEIELITKRTEEQALLLRQQALQEVDKIIFNRQLEAKNMIDRLRNEAINTIQEEATARTLAVFETLISKELSSAQQENINDRAIAQIASQLHKAHPTNAVKSRHLKSKRSRNI
ncbi:MAG: hypothetical protein FJ390_08505 [Verrucomicrobia bacterium]|nr:hypothetical protein [Alphaproteobacteria bacterium]MBM3857979.1 hypothetical protein [Verrucomicrobiota bacterium]